MYQVSESQEQISPESRYKLLNINTYSDTEWLADFKKQYRQVFDVSELTYVYVEVSFINKSFEKEPWSANIALKCFDVERKHRPLCHIQSERDIATHESTVFIREGWGNKSEGTFWKTGTYYWEVWIDGQKVGTKHFFVQSGGGLLDLGPDNYCRLIGVRLYEGAMADPPDMDRMYLSKFDAASARFVYLDLEFENYITEESWHMELITKFLTESKDLKGRVVKFVEVHPEERTLSLTVGWGSDVAGSWRRGMYTAELTFLDKLIGTVYIEMDETAEYGSPYVLLRGHEQPIIFGNSLPTPRGYAAAMERLDTLIGLGSVKKQIRDRAKYMEFLQLRERKGFLELSPVQLHAVFRGNPGTGKTTVAELLGAIYFELGLLTKGHVHTVDRSELVGEYIGQTAPKVKETIEKARGGILFIDEAYALARINDDSKDFGKEAIEILVKEMSDGQGDLAVIVAGYPSEMNHFISSNPGLKSRFKMDIFFPDYVPEELAQIALMMAEDIEINLDDDCKTLLNQILTREYRDRDKSFGNARLVKDLLERAKVQMGLRIMNDPDHERMDYHHLSTLKVEDIINARIIEEKSRLVFPIDEELLRESLDELENLHGLDKIKKEISDSILLVRYYLASGESLLNRFSMHTLFIGNPGTGKTTVARILAKIYKALGLLERGHVVETDRQGLVAGYVGQTAIKTAERVEEANGGVLFIDEAYSLSQAGSGTAGDFGDEVIQTLLKRMEDQRGKFFVFASGYPDNMDKFLKANPGLKSRFDKTLFFDDYNAEELTQIAHWQIENEGFRIEFSAGEQLRSWIERLHRQRDKYFGNARVIRQITDSLIRVTQTKLAQSMADGNVSLEKVIDSISVQTTMDHFDGQEWTKPGIGFGAHKSKK